MQLRDALSLRRSVRSGPGVAFDRGDSGERIRRLAESTHFVRHGAHLETLNRSQDPSVNDSLLGPALGSPLPQDERADLIIAAALVAFGENGYGNTRLADIARRAGVSTSTVLRYFASKDEIFREVIRTTLLGSLSLRDDAAVPAQESSAADTVRAFARRYWTMMERPELAAIVRLAIGELPRFPELAVFHATEALERFVRTLERIIEGGIARGELRPADARAAARTILATLAAHALWFAYPGIYAGVTGSDREHAVATTIETLIQTLGPVAPATMPSALTDG